MRKGKGSTMKGNRILNKNRWERVQTKFVKGKKKAGNNRGVSGYSQSQEKKHKTEGVVRLRNLAMKTQGSALGGGG